jgi:hypothetical protein
MTALFYMVVLDQFDSMYMLFVWHNLSCFLFCFPQIDSAAQVKMFEGGLEH